MTAKPKTGQAVGGMVAAARFASTTNDDKPRPDKRTGRRLGRTYTIQCGHKSCMRAATEGESFRIKTPPGSRYKTTLIWFYRCDRHEHSHWRQIGYPPKRGKAKA